MAIKIEEFINELKEMKVLELNNLIKAIETEFGVSAAAMAATSSSENKEEDDKKTVSLVSPGGNKIAVIKLVKELLNLGLMDAKKFVDSGGVIKEGISSTEADELAGKFKEIGAEVKVK